MKPLTASQVEALHHLAENRAYRANSNSCKALVARGYATVQRSYYGARSSYTITDEGRAAHDAIYTPEKIAADKAAEQAEKDARVRAAQEKRARLQEVANQRNAAAHELAKLVGEEGRKLLPYGLIEGAQVHNDGSGVWGGETMNRMTSTQILAIVKAALAEAQR